MQWETIGRKGLLYTKKLLGLLEYNPYMAGAVFVGGFILLGSMVMFFCWHFSNENENYPYAFLGMLFSTCPVWMTQLYFGLQRAEVVFGMIYATISVFCLCEILFMKQRQIYWYILYVIGIWSFASYQGCVTFYITLCIIAYLLDILKDADKSWREYLKNIIWLIIGLGILGLMLAPFLMSIYIGDRAVDRTQFAQPLVSAVACILLWGYISKDKKLVWIKRLSMLAGVAIIWISMSTIFRVEYTEDIRYQEDRMVAENIANDLYEIDGAKDLPVVFIGTREAELNNACLQYDMYGMSYFQWDYGTTWRILGFMETMGIHLEDGSKYREKAVKVSRDMNSYPENGYIAVRDKYVVVKLSDVDN